MIDFLNHSETQRIIENGLKEDIGPGDFTTLSTVPRGHDASARCLIKEEGIVAGVAAAHRVLATVDPKLRVEAFIEDGKAVKPGDEVFYVHGDPRSILQAERLLLNIMQRMSGIATATQKAVSQLKGTACRILDTRKTTPLFRHFEKWAVHLGGGVNHRFGLYDMVMIKDNHVDYAGSITQALQSCRSYLAENELDLAIEIETRNLEEVQQVLDAGGADRIMLDNMDLETMTQAVKMIKGRAETEASGGITWDKLPVVAATGVDFISMGALTHTIDSLDISLKAL
ncbi:MAG: carboxylating nicotinate-nucleotide diphosphorylase [Bacteroidota bacterium]